MLPILLLSGILQAGGGVGPHISLAGIQLHQDVRAAGIVHATGIVSQDTLNIRIPGSDVTFRMIPMRGGQTTIGRASLDEAKPGDGPSKDASPIVSVRISPFWIAETETTYDAFAIFRFKNRDSDSTSVNGVTLPVDAVTRPSTPYEDPSFGMDGPGTPVVGVTQWSALQYARWLSAKTGIFFRLPTEAEWEYACRAGSRNPGQGSFGFDAGAIEDHAWFADNSGGRLQQVAQKLPGSSGLFDMNGNAAEWTLDQYDAAYYSSLVTRTEPVVDPWRKPEKLHPRTVRGGSFGSSADELDCTRREESSLRWKRRDPQIPRSRWWNTDSPFVGFRLVAPVHVPARDEQKAFWLLVLGQ